MKKLGLLGGTSYPSTILYYQRLNELVNQEKGANHSCPLILYNIDYEPIKSRYKEGWDEIPDILKKEIQTLLDMNPDSLMICNNTLHKAFDKIKNELKLNIPVFHCIELTIEELAKTQEVKKVVLLGTRFTMEDGYFKEPLQKAGYEVLIPNEAERIQIQEIQTQLARGILEKDFIDYFQKLMESYVICDKIILACTELPLVFNHIKTDKIINTLELQCRKAVDFLLI